MVMLIDNILSGLGTTSSRSGNGSAHRGGTTTTTTTTIELPSSTATHKSGYSASNGSVEYHDSAGLNYTIDSNGNLKTWSTAPTDTYGGAGNDEAAGTPAGTPAAEEKDNTLLYVLLPILALVGVKLYQRYTSGNSRKKRKK